MLADNNTWIETTIGALVDQKAITIQTGPFGSQLHSYDYVPVGIPVIPTEAIGRRKLVTDGIPHVSQETANRLSRHKVQPGDILFARRGIQATGLSALVQDEQAGWLCGTGAILLRVNNPAIDPSYLSFVLSTDVTIEWLKQHAVGAVMPNLNETVIRGLKIPLPSFDEQRAIADILSSLDDKIELNRRMNHTLEALARALFKSWFVDFDPVRAKMEGRIPAGMDAETAALFPSAFEGDVPQGWKISGLDGIATYLNGLALQKFPPNGDAYLPVIKIAQMRTNDTRDADRASADIDPAYIVNDGDILFSWSGSLAVIIWSGGKGALNQHLFKVTSEKYPKWFYYLWTLHHLEDFQAIAADKATTMGHIQRHHLSDAKVIIPDEQVLAWMTEQMSPLIDLYAKNAVQSRTLAALRDALLPRLMSGEVRVKDEE